MSDVTPPPTILFVTGKLAEPALRRLLADLAPRAGIDARVAVLPITVAALTSSRWVARHLHVPRGIDRIILPGYCRGDLGILAEQTGVPVERGPKDLRDLPEYLGQRSGPPPGYGAYSVAILAEINHAPQLSLESLVQTAQRYITDGADLVDLGCDPGTTWAQIGTAVRALREVGVRVSVDSFNPLEVEAALAAGAERVLSINRGNLDQVARWQTIAPEVEVVAIPDTPSDLDSLAYTVAQLETLGVRYHLDPILEPIGYGFAASLGRYLEVRRRYPDAPMMMGVGNLTELTDVDSAGINVLLAGFCQELGIGSVLTTEVANWCRSAVREFDRARRLVYYAVQEGTLPKRLDPGLVILRDPRRHSLGPEGLAELAQRVTDRNYRLFAEDGELHIINGQMYLHGTDPFALFAEVCRRDAKMDPSHAFYLGYELAKAVTALTLDKQYTQDQPLRWGILTLPEPWSRGSETTG